MSIKGRIRRQEKAEGRCPECREAHPAIHVFYPGEKEPDPEYCSKCDRSLGMLIRVVYEDEGEA